MIRQRTPNILNPVPFSRNRIEVERLYDMDTEQIPVEQRTTSHLIEIQEQAVKEEEASTRQGAIILGGFILFGILSLVVYTLFQVGRSEDSADSSASSSQHSSHLSSKKNSLTSTERGQSASLGSSAEIEVTNQTATPEICAELKRIESETGLPAQIFKEKVPEEENISAKLSEELQPAHLSELANLRREIRDSGDWGVNTESLKKSSTFLDTLSEPRQNIRAMLDKPGTRYEQVMVKSEDDEKELAPDDNNIDFLWAYSTLEEYEIAKALEKGDTGAAVQALMYILTLAELVSQTEFPVARKHAVFLRENGFRILQTLVRHPKFNRDEMQKMYGFLRKQLENWPDDAKCWIGDRASGLKVYELLRRGKIDDALEEEEKDELARRNLLNKVAWMKPAEFNGDQAAYLRAMQEMIDGCKKPFYARLPLLNEIDQHFKSLDGTSQYPAIAALLTQGIFDGMKAQAEDRVRVEVWFLTLATALNRVLKEGAQDPLKGDHYIIQKPTIQDRPIVVVSQGSGFYKAEMDMPQ
ncbi:MAG: hypothetical protein ACRC10_08365 [Thermoguttaceae bacterium]